MTNFLSDVTVAIPTIPERAHFLSKAVFSAANQEHMPEAILVAVDNEREGAAKTRNRIIQSIDTTWTAFLDDDDLLKPDHLQICIQALEETGADLVYPYPLFSNGKDPLATLQNGQVVIPFGVPFGPEQEWWFRNKGNFIPVTHVCRTSLVKEVGGFPEQGSFALPPGNNSGDCEDYGLLLKMLDAGAKFHHVPQRTWLYNFHDSNTGGKPLVI